jgi:tetratricopeptide (TPR) repeat protein
MWKLDTAERAFRDAIRAAGSFSYARARLAALLAARRQYAEARALAADLVAERPDYQPGRIALAGILAEIGRTSEAAKILKEATLSPEHEADARVALTELHLMAGEPQQAVESARIAAHARATAQTYAVLSRAFLGARNVGEAITAARTALQKDEQSPAAHVALARALMVKNELEEAMQHAQAALEAYPYSVEALEVAGEIEAARADWQKCAEYWQRALALNPWDGPLHRRISEVLGPHLGDWAGTAEHHQRYVELEKMKAAVAR